MSLTLSLVMDTEGKKTPIHNDVPLCEIQPMETARGYRLLQCKPIFHWFKHLDKHECKKKYI